MLIIGAFIILLILLAVFGVGIGIAAAFLAVLGVLFAAGIISTSAFYALHQRSLLKGVRIAIYETLMVLGALAGFGAGLLAEMFGFTTMSAQILLPAATLSGAAAGAAIAWVWLWTCVAAWQTIFGRSHAFEVQPAENPEGP